MPMKTLSKPKEDLITKIRGSHAVLPSTTSSAYLNNHKITKTFDNRHQRFLKENDMNLFNDAHKNTKDNSSVLSFVSST